MKSPHYKRLLSMFLAAGMTLSLMPNVYAEETDSDPVDVVEETTEETESDESVSQDSNVEESETVEEDETPDVSVLLDSTEEKTHEVFSTTNSTIAPGVTQSINYAYSADGKQMVYYVATADVTRNDVIVQSSYKDAQCENLGMSKLTEQMAAANSVYSDPNNEKYISDYYTAVAGVNASFYNMTTGQPMGYTVLDGKYFGTDSYDNFFAILKDGSAVIDYRSNLSKYEENVWQAVGGSQMLVYNGQDVTANVSGSYNTDRHSRTCVGVTADGKVVMMVLDGRQEPFSCGGSMHELAQIMLEQGCVTAINLDGGGSTTYAARQEGANEVTVVNRPSDGSERSISSGLIIASLAAPSDVFERATLTAEHNYVTPNSVVNVTATGVSPAGTAAQIPESATWESTLGTIDENGTFTSDGTLGDAKISMLVDGVVVGETTIHVVNPDGLEFSNASITVPYGKSVNLNIKATYGKNKVYYNVDDLEFELEDDSVGTIEGLKFTAIEEDEDITSSLITAFLKANEEINCSAQILLGKGSETVADFEENDGAIKDYTIGTGYPQYGPAGANGQNECGSIKVVTKENGKVHDGDYALAVECDFSQAYETGYHMLSLSGLNIKAPAKATAIGMWIYIPELEEISTTSMRLTGKTEGSATNDVTSPWLWENCEPYGWSNNGWRYVSMDLTGYDADITFNTLQIYICDRDNSDVGFYFKENASVNGKFTYYIDSITVDYSEAVEDREAPVFENITYADGTMSDATVLNGQTATTSKVSFAVNVEDDTTKDNSTGLDENSAKAYIDGVETTCKFNGKTMSIEDAVLADGVHTIKFEIVDKLGNSAYVTKQITVKANSNMSTVTLQPTDKDLNNILIGSLYWMDVVASDVEKVQSVTMELNLNSVSQWELDHMNVAYGFEATYTIDEVTNDATITITRTSGNNATGQVVLAQLPIRTWESRLTEYPGYEDQTPEKLWQRKIIWPIDIKLSANLGSIAYTDGTTGSFSMSPVKVDTELYGNYSALNANGDYANKKSWHYHNATNTVALEDKAATCTEPGYTGRTFCNDCNSVVDWGTTIPATGHTYDFVDGVLQCTSCNETYTGTWTDGLVYENGQLKEGWLENSYYSQGTKLTGIHEVASPDGKDTYYYDFGEDGISKGKYTGFMEDDFGKYYVANGTSHVGWVISQNEDVYYLGTHHNGKYYVMTGEVELGNPLIKYIFNENGVLTSGSWYENDGQLSYYWAGKAVKHKFFEIDGNTYFFGNDTNPVKGIQKIVLTHGDEGEYYWFDENSGILQAKFEGNGLKIYGDNAHIVYLKDGVPQYVGLVQDEEGNYYYINSSLEAVKNRTYGIGEAKTNGLLPAGTYQFGEDGKMINPPTQPETPPTEPETPPTEPEEPGVKNGLVKDEDGEIRYYVDGVAQYKGLVQDSEGNYYYVNSTKKAVRNCTYGIGEAKTNGLLPAGTYQFGEDGKMINPPTQPETPPTEPEEPGVKNGLVKDEDGEIRYYVDGVAQYKGLVQDSEGNYYYVNSTKKAVRNCTYGIGEAKTNGLLPAGTYQFGEDGKMINPPTQPETPPTEPEEPGVKNGLVKDEDGEIRYYVDGVAQYKGLVQDSEGNYYYVNSTKKAVRNCTYGIGEAKTNGLLPAGKYQFGEDGKMINPPTI